MAYLRNPISSLKKIEKNYRHNILLRFDKHIFGQYNEPASQLLIGNYSGGHNACGIVAIYNALALLGGSESPADIIKKIEASKSLDGVPWVAEGAAGVSMKGIVRYFCKSYSCRLNRNDSTNNCDAEIINSIAAIVRIKVSLFRRHYVTVQWGGTQFAIYNETGRDDCCTLHSSIDMWLKNNKYSAISMVLINKRGNI